MADFRLERVGHHFNGYIKKQGVWKPLFPGATILSSVLGALEREISDVAMKL